MVLSYPHDSPGSRSLSGLRAGALLREVIEHPHRAEGVDDPVGGSLTWKAAAVQVAANGLFGNASGSGDFEVGDLLVRKSGANATPVRKDGGDVLAHDQ